MGLQARLIGQALRKLSGSLSRSGTTAVFINQLREKIGVMFGSPETTPGGRALKFYSSVRLDIRRIGALKMGNDAVGNQTRVKVVKNKVAPPFKTVEFDVMYGEGISREGSLLDVGIEHDVVQKSGAWFAYGDERLGQGRENAKQFLKENYEVRERIFDDIYEKLGFNEPVEAVEEPGESRVEPGATGSAWRSRPDSCSTLLLKACPGRSLRQLFRRFGPSTSRHRRAGTPFAREICYVPPVSLAPTVKYSLAGVSYGKYHRGVSPVNRRLSTADSMYRPGTHRPSSPQFSGLSSPE